MTELLWIVVGGILFAAFVAVLHWFWENWEK
jgi:hypothetical protein